MSIDKWTKRSTLVQLAYPVNFGRARKRLSQSEHCQAEAKNHYCANDQLKPPGRVNKDEDGCKIDQQTEQLHYYEPRSVRIE